MNILTIGYTTEGRTDQRFLGNIIRRTFEDLALECEGQIEVYEPQHISIDENTFVSEIIKSAKQAKWAHVLCVHTDSDDPDDYNAFNYKITPSFQAVEKELGQVCKNLVAIVPIQMTEAWMLADKELFKEEIGTHKSNTDLGLPKLNQIENTTDPKARLTNAIRLAYEDLPKRRKRPNLSELYTPLSQKIDVTILEKLSSYRKFKESARDALRKLRYLR